MKIIPPGGSVVFDGGCGICTHIVRILKRLDWGHRLAFFANNDPATFDRFPEITLERAREEMLAHDPRSGWYGGYEAFEWVACRVPALWIFIPFTLIPGIGYVGDKAYKCFARNRHKISAWLGLEACKIS